VSSVDETVVKLALERVDWTVVLLGFGKVESLGCKLVLEMVVSKEIWMVSNLVALRVLHLVGCSVL
jgi:hypothetical protein